MFSILLKSLIETKIVEVGDFWFHRLVSERDIIKRYVNHKIKVNDVQTHKIRQVLKGLSFGKFSLSTFRRKGHIDKWVKKPTYYHFSCLGSGSCESKKKNCKLNLSYNFNFSEFKLDNLHSISMKYCIECTKSSFQD